MNKRFQALAELYKAGKVAEKKVAALKAAADQPKPPSPPGAPPPPTTPDMPFSDTSASSASTARFIIGANEHRLAKCPPGAPTGDDEASRTAAFIIKVNNMRLGKST